MNGTVERRAAYEILRRNPQGTFVEERPALFSPAAAAQDGANASRLYFHWNPIFVPYEFTHWLEEAGAPPPLQAGFDPPHVPDHGRRKRQEQEQLTHAENKHRRHRIHLATSRRTISATGSSARYQ